MKEKLLPIFSSPLKRAAGYLTTYAIVAALIELARHLLPLSTQLSLVVLGIIAAGVLIGGLFICQRNVLSRATSASTLFVLGFLAMAFDGAVPSSYVLLIVLMVSILGAQSFLHDQPNKKTSIFYTACVVAIAVALAFGILFATVTINRMAIYS